MEQMVGSALIELRKALGETQQQFAYRMKTAIRTIARWEGGSPPRPKALMQFAQYARSVNRHDLEKVFSAALTGDLITSENRLDGSIVIALTENRGRLWLRDELQRLLTDARAGFGLNYPPVYEPSGAPAQQSRIDYLEVLLVELRLELKESATEIIESLVADRRVNTGETIEQARASVFTRHHQLWERSKVENAKGILPEDFKSRKRAKGRGVAR